MGKAKDKSAVNFSAEPVRGESPLTVQFTDTSIFEEGAITSWSWDFENDGKTDSTLQNPSFTYRYSGTYSVKLTVITAAGTESKLKSNYISVQPGPNEEIGSRGSGGEVGLQSKTITVGGIQRSFQLYVPETYDWYEPIPVLVYLHGAGGSSSEGISLWQSDASAYYLIVATPQSGVVDGTYKWDFADTSNTSEDIDFIQAMLDYIEDDYNVAIKREYSVGFSNGAFYSIVLGLKLSRRLAACCSHSGGLTGYTYVYPSRLIPIYLIHGEADATVPIVRSEDAYSNFTAWGIEVRFDRLPGVGHNYVRSKNADIWTWFTNHPLP
ncbi:MAG: PKD domain-containing protein [Planctomycetota bacterium]